MYFNINRYIETDIDLDTPAERLDWDALIDVYIDRQIDGYV